MQLFYNPQITESDQQFTFNKIESKHIVRVLRKNEGDLLYITNGNGFLFSAKISIANDKNCIVNIIDSVKKTKPWHYNLHIAIAPTKNNDRFEWFLEKATEVGIDEITPIICERSERKVLKLDRMQKIIESAAKQSLKYNFPKLNEPSKFEDFINTHSSGKLFIAHCENLKKEPLQLQCKTEDKITILIGPEGDFTPNEINKATAKNYRAITLGESRLRTETAGIIATHTISLVNNRE